MKLVSCTCNTQRIVRMLCYSAMDLSLQCLDINHTAWTYHCVCLLSFWVNVMSVQMKRFLDDEEVVSDVLKSRTKIFYSVDKHKLVTR